jgi:hypothetical protein
MTGYFDSFLIFTFLIFYLFFRKERIRKLKNNLPLGADMAIIEKYFKVNNRLSLLCIIGSLYVCSFPGLHAYLFPFKIYNIELINAIGTLLIKISFIWLIICGLGVSDHLDFFFQPLTIQKMSKIEMAMIIAVVLLSIGAFFSVPSLGTLFISAFSITSFLILRKKLQGLEIINPHQTNETLN